MAGNYRTNGNVCDRQVSGGQDKSLGREQMNQVNGQSGALSRNYDQDMARRQLLRR